MTPSEMIAQIREHYGLKRNIDFATKMGLSPQNALVWANRQTLDYDLLHQKFPELSADWLLSHGEEGEMIRSLKQDVSGSGNHVAGRDIHIGEGEEVMKVVEGLRAALLNEQSMNKQLLAQNAALLKIMENLTGGKGDA